MSPEAKVLFAWLVLILGNICFWLWIYIQIREKTRYEI